MKTRSDKTVSLQFGSWGRVTNLAEKDFTFGEDTPFLVCNESDEDVFLDVLTAEGMLVENARFRPGYDPKMITCIKQNVGVADDVLLWGN